MRTLAIWLPLWLAPVLVLWLWTGEGSVWTQLGRFFSTMAVVTFGGAYAVLAYVAQAAVETYGWLQPGEMIDGLGLAETTPGPLILVLQFVGFLAGMRGAGDLPPLLAGSLGALLTLWVTFAPCFLWIFLGGPYVEALRGNRALSAALGAITAAVVGVIMNLALWFGLHVLFGRSGRCRSWGCRRTGRCWRRWTGAPRCSARRHGRDAALQGRDDPDARRLWRRGRDPHPPAGVTISAAAARSAR